MAHGGHQGDADAQFNLGIMYDQGLGVNQDLDEATRLYRSAADQGHARAHNNLGLMYADGDSAKQYFGEALRWFRKAAALQPSYLLKPLM